MRGDIVPPERPKIGTTPRPGTGDTQTATEPLAPRDLEQESSKESAVRDMAPLVLESRDQTPLANQGRRSNFKKNRGVRVILGAAAGIIVLCLIAASGWYLSQVQAVNASDTEKVLVTIEPGSGLSQIASTLKRDDLIKSELAFEMYVRLNDKTSGLQSGTYRLSKSEDVPAIVKHLTSGNTDTFSITFLPGATLSKHREVLISSGYSEAEVDSALAKNYDHPIFEGKPSEADLEGYIYGETYNFTSQSTVDQILVRTFDEYKKAVDENDLISKYKQQGFSLYQGITMASIIQREVATAEDAAQVAQVFKKRYDMGMQLGSDVTYQYIADKTGQPRSVDFDSPYNTRRYAGLPPGPISSPGIASLRAVGSPAPGDFLYFLSGDDDKTYFAVTNEEHERNIRDHCQKKCQII